MEKVTSKVEYTEELLKEFNRLHNRYSTRVLEKMVDILVVIAILAELILLFIVGVEAFNLKLIFADLVFVMLLVVNKTNILSDFSTKIFLKSDKINLNSKAVQTFTNESVNIVDELQNVTLPYDKLYKVMETDKYIFYYLNRIQAGIVIKENNTNEEIEYIVNKLKSNVKKYIVYKK